MAVASGCPTCSAPDPTATACARPSSSARRGRWSPRSPAPATTTPGLPTRSPGRCSTCSTAASTSPGRRPWRGTSGHGLTGEEADLRMGRRFSVARRLAGLFASYAGQRPSLVADWSAGRDTDGAGAPLAADLAWQPELWRRLVDRVDAPSPLERHGDTVEPAARGPRGVRPADAALAVRPHPAVGDRDRPARRAGGRARRPRLAAAPVAGALGPRSAGAAARSSGPPTTATRRVRHPLLVEPRARHPRAPAGAGRSPRSRPTPRSRRTSPPDTLLGWLQADLAADDPASGRADARRRTTGRSRCTPATASPARSTCCARCCSACSPTTRRSSRATCW